MFDRHPDPYFCALDRVRRAPEIRRVWLMAGAVLAMAALWIVGLAMVVGG